MAPFKYNITIEAPTEKEAFFRLQALVIIAPWLSTEELENMVKIIEKDPAKFAMAKAALAGFIKR